MTSSISQAGFRPNSVVTTLLVLICAIAISGCGGGVGKGLFSGFGDSDAPPIRTVAVAPVIGAPRDVSAQLASQVAAAARENDVRIELSDEADYTLRGYLAAANAPNGVRVSYIWDVIDQAGARAHRITGEEVIAKRGNDMWAGLPGFASQRIADKTAVELSRWLAGAGTATVQPVATAPQANSGDQTAAAPARPQRESREQPQQQTAAPRPEPEPAPQQQAAAPRQESQTFIAPVTGAPGDGSGSLRDAMRRKLISRGVNIASSPSGGAYTVRGVVSLQPEDGGKEKIRIDWQVIDPSGRRLGTVSQQNSIPKGSLNGAWGKVADAAASAATDGVMKLLPDPSG